MPNWVIDHDVWDKAKRAVKPSGDDSGGSYYAKVSFVYKKMGGRVKKKKEKISKAFATGYPLQGRKRYFGMDISIENRRGSVRSGVSDDGRPWRTKMMDDYGYIRRTEGTDGDHIDCFLGKLPPEAAPKVFVIHQIDQKTGKFDEDKCMIGYRDRDAAINAYKRNYEAGWKTGPITEYWLPEFKEKSLMTLHKNMKKSESPLRKAIRSMLIEKAQLSMFGDMGGGEGGSVKTHNRKTASGGMTVVRRHWRHGVDVKHSPWKKTNKEYNESDHTRVPQVRVGKGGSMWAELKDGSFENMETGERMSAEKAKKMPTGYVEHKTWVEFAKKLKIPVPEHIDKFYKDPKHGEKQKDLFASKVSQPKRGQQSMFKAVGASSSGIPFFLNWTTKAHQWVKEHYRTLKDGRTIKIPEHERFDARTKKAPIKPIRDRKTRLSEDEIKRRMAHHEAEHAKKWAAREAARKEHTAKKKIKLKTGEEKKQLFYSHKGKKADWNTILGTYEADIAHHENQYEQLARDLENLKKNKVEQRARQKKINAKVDKAVKERKAKATGKLTTERPPTDASTYAWSADWGTRYDVKHKLVEAEDLIPSHDWLGNLNPKYNQEVQPRNRARLANREQVVMMARRMNPEGLLLDMKRVTEGSPIVGSDNCVESGNGRTISLLYAKDHVPESWKKYQDTLRANAEGLGIDQAELAKFKNPILVRERVSGGDDIEFRREFAKKANSSASIGMSTMETAMVDAESITDDMMTLLKFDEDNPDKIESIGSALRRAENRPFQTAYLSMLPENEQATLLNRSGQISKYGIDRITAAMIIKAFGRNQGLPVADMFLESLDENPIKNFEKSFMATLPMLAKNEADLRDGGNEDVSLMPDILDSLYRYSVIKNSGQKVREALGQKDFLNEASSLQKQMILYFDKVGTSTVKIRRLFTQYHAAAKRMPNKRVRTRDLFGGAAAESKIKSPADMWTDVMGRVKKDEAEYIAMKKLKKEEKAARDEFKRQMKEYDAKQKAESQAAKATTEEE